MTGPVLRKYTLLVLPNKASVQILRISGTHIHTFISRCVLSVLGEISRIISVADPVPQGGGAQELFSGGNAKQSEQMCGRGFRACLWAIKSSRVFDAQI